MSIPVPRVLLIAVVPLQPADAAVGRRCLLSLSRVCTRKPRAALPRSGHWLSLIRAFYKANQGLH